MRWLLALPLVAACSGSAESIDDAAPAAEVSRTTAASEVRRGKPKHKQARQAATNSPEASAAAPPPALPPEIRSVRMRRSMSVRAKPSSSAAKVGTIAAYTQSRVRGTAGSGSGCTKRWLAIEPFGWVCEDYVEATKRPPSAVELPKLGRGELVPGVYGKVRGDRSWSYKLVDNKLVPERALAGSVHVRRYGELDYLPEHQTDEGAQTVETADGQPPTAAPGVYWRFSKTEYVAVAGLRLHRPSSYSGVRLGDDTGLTLPLVFALDRRRLDHNVATTSRPGGGHRVRKIPGRSAWPVREIARSGDATSDTTAFRIGPNEWLSAERARLIEASPPPPGLLEGEKWIDVDLDRQVLVAYEGTEPVFATLISSGSRKHTTETGIYRIWIKFSETAMSGQMADEAPYSVATVPWTQYYSKDLALHTSYWHDGFGTRRSHGCVNLAPIDARFVYFWSDPAVPPGWSMAHGTVEHPGSLVRVRSRANPNPEWRGYANDVLNARLEAMQSL